MGVVDIFKVENFNSIGLSVTHRAAFKEFFETLK
jgi:hypothetical protein